MATTYVYQNSAVIERIGQEYIASAAEDDPIFNILPIRRINASRLRWVIKDNFSGLMGLRGLGGSPIRVDRVGDNIYETPPGAFGDFVNIDEIEMTNRAAGLPPSMDIPIDVGDLVAEGQEILAVRQAQRMKQESYALVLAGTVSIKLPDGGVGFSAAYTPQTSTPSPAWSTLTTSTPLANLRGLQATFGIGTAGKFGAAATMYMNSVTLNYMLNNSNAADLGGKRLDFGQSLNDAPTLRRLLAAADLPSIVVHDDGYIDDSGTFQIFIPNGKIIVVAARPNNEAPGAFQITRNVNNPDKGPRPYAFVKDYTRGPIQTVPPHIEVHQGFNGGPVIQRASQIVILTVS